MRSCGLLTTFALGHTRHEGQVGTAGRRIRGRRWLRWAALERQRLGGGVTLLMRPEL